MGEGITGTRIHLFRQRRVGGEPVEWKTALFTFALIFFAELGDKTQLTIFALSARTRDPWMVFSGAAVALILSTLLASLIGETVLQNLPVKWIRLITGLAFVFMGLLLIGRTYR